MTAVAAAPPAADHDEFDAVLEAPYRVGGNGAAAAIKLHFSDPGAPRRRVAWRLDLHAPDGAPVDRWRGAGRLRKGVLSVTIPWPQRATRLPDGIYRLRLQADAAAGSAQARDIVEQRWEIAVGQPPAPAMPPFQPMSTLRTPAPAGAMPAADALPYTVYLGNLHSQTGHSDGGGSLDNCSGAQPPQSAADGPAEAYEYARRRGLDFLMTSEHNHMYDGAEGGNPAADAAQARALYQSGLSAAAAYNAAHPDFLAIYGMEWGVINNGGHVNILNSEQLLGWERNANGELLADTESPKGDYAALYALMHAQGWLGQFNHPKPDQFRIGGVPLAYSLNGDTTMALCEVMNSNAFSVNTTETDTRRSNFEDGCNAALEAGFHIAFSSNQDNHCANWGAAYSNRSGVLIPAGSALTPAGFLEAVRARRVYATMDKHAQLVLTANGHLMGARIGNSGPLHLLVRHANTAGRGVATVAIFEGVPRRRGAVTQLSDRASTTVTPAPGEHFYYAKVTQDDGKILWSAPIWVSQQ